MTAVIGIINYGIGNIASVQAALDRAGLVHQLLASPEGFKSVSHLILPGVGAFEIGMKNLHERGFVEPIRHWALKDRKPFLGICLGMQLLATESEEFGKHQGLDLIPGKVCLLEAKGLRLPHVGWNDIHLEKEDPVFRQEFSSQDFYFVHSYHFVPQSSADTTATADYGHRFTACVSNGNIFGAQFHPEKSQKMGIKLLQNFGEVVSDPC
jgi:glutamine amidotransferase